MAIYFNQQTRQFSTQERVENKMQKRYDKLKSKGLSHQETIDKLTKQNKRGAWIGRGLVVADSLAGLSNIPAAKANPSLSNKAIAGVSSLNLLMHGAGLAAIRHKYNKRKEAIKNIDLKNK